MAKEFLSSLIAKANGAASTPPLALTGTWFTGGTTTTTKPHVLIEPAGTTSTNWSISGTGFGINAPSGYAGNLLDLQVAGTRKLVINSSGYVGLGTSSPESPLHITMATNLAATQPGIFISSADDAGFIWKGALRLIHNSDVTINANSAIGFIFEPRASTGSPFTGTAAIKGVIENSTVNNQDTALTFWTRAGASNNTTDTEKMRISSLGYVGIGTTNPSSLLHLADAGHITVGTSTGTKIGTATNQKLAFFNSTPIVQPASANQAALTNNTGGTADGTLSAVGNTTTVDQSGVINNNFTELFRLQNEMRNALVNLGLIKGAA